MFTSCERPAIRGLSPRQIQYVRVSVTRLRQLHPERRNLHRLPSGRLVTRVICRCLEIHPERQEEYLRGLTILGRTDRERTPRTRRTNRGNAKNTIHRR